jgi:uncharacterized membrane protein
MKALITSLVISLALLVFLPFAALADNPAKSAAQCGVNAAAGVNNVAESDCPAPGNGALNIGDLIKRIINILTMLVGAVAVVMLIVAGFRYVTSAGSDAGTAAAKKTIIYAIVGLIVVALAQVIVHFVINNVVNANSNNPSPTPSSTETIPSQPPPGTAIPQ